MPSYTSAERTVWCGVSPMAARMLSSARATCSGRVSYETTWPVGPTARSSAVVSAPDPSPASSTRAPG